ncbi:esterase/lipase family protein [Natronospira bacteriovora]|uniref:Alpha/beta hydrolase n=1 Tax=Natronospira bacteriovora TaxID=3069753 RepID=A0ABU0W938_9GAMM|nr:alpha/beta hydrolase [Natronospira sp. AB-CW4]MDQ2070433.1 alpha/beta hydrolase [Natronospira sp. AB-CW4]
MPKQQGTQPAETVVFIHGLWMTGMELFYLRRQVREAGYATEQFSYRTLSGTLDENAESLHDFLQTVDGTRIHLVAHSLGGLLTLRLFERYGSVISGRIVFLGSPVRGSQAARATAANRFGEVILGRSGQEGLLEEREPVWSWPNGLGVLAGTRGIGVGVALSELPEPNDGTVAVEETELVGASDYILLDVSHTSMLMSRQVADQIVAFLRDGCFDHG